MRCSLPLQQRLACSLLVLIAGLFVAGDARSSEKTPEEPSKVKISGLFYFSYHHGYFHRDDQSKFLVKRMYVTTKAEVFPFLSGRVTFDTTQDLEGDGRGDMEVRLKYAYAKFHFGDLNFLHHLNLEVGMVHMVWLDFEEHIILYRMRAPMFMERSGIFNSADFGLTLNGLLGPQVNTQAYPGMPDKYPGRHGSFAVGFYNGGGYHGQEFNSNKALEARLTLRPQPRSVPGFQISGLAIVGDGNIPDETVDAPEWTTYCGFLSYQHRHFVLAGQYSTGRGNQAGTWVESDDPSRSTPFDGHAIFAEDRLGRRWRMIGGFDRFERESSSADYGFRRAFVGLGFDFGDRNILLFDYDYRTFDDSSLRDEHRYQLTFQMRF